MAQVITDSSSYHKYPIDGVKSDINFLVNTIRDVHPDMFSKIDSSEFYTLKDSIISSIKNPLSALQFYKLAAPLIAKVGDAHTILDLPWNEWDNYLAQGGNYFPFKVRWLDGLRVLKSYNSNITPGTRLISIDGMQCDSLFNEFMNYRGSEQISYSRFITASYFRYYLWLNGISPPYLLVTSTPSGKLDTVMVDGTVPDKSGLSLPFYSYNRLEHNIGYIDLRRMRDKNDEPFEDFLERIFTDLKVNDSPGLIVDLRNCAGGNNEFGKMLLEYITDKSFRMTAEKHWKVSRQYKDYLRNNIKSIMRWVTYPPAVWLGELFADELKMFTYDDGEIIHIRNSEYIPGSNNLRYSGKLCFLIGSATFSSGVDLANAVQDYNIAPLFGEETGGIPNTFGESLHFDLPFTGLGASSASARFVKANGDSLFRGGIAPDIVIHYSVDDLCNNNDKIIDKAIEWIKK